MCISLDNQARQEYEAREKSLREKTSSISKAKRDGIELGHKQGVKQGLEQGKNEEKIKNAKNLLDLLDDQVIADKIGLSLEDVKKLRDN